MKSLDDDVIELIYRKPVLRKFKVGDRVCIGGTAYAGLVISAVMMRRKLVYTLVLDHNGQHANYYEESLVAEALVAKG